MHRLKGWVGWGNAFSQVLWRSDERNERSRCRGLPMGYDTENREMEWRAKPKLLLQQEHCVEVRNPRRCVVLPWSGLSISSAEGFPWGHGWRYADAAASNNALSVVFCRIKKETLKRLETLYFIDVFKKMPHLKGWAGWGRNIVCIFLSEEKRNERFCLGAGTFNRSREPKREHCV